MNREEIIKQFEKNVEYLKRNIPPDDIYVFAEQTFMAAMYFMHKWSAWEELPKVMLEDDVANKWITNIFGLHISREKGEDVDLDLDIS